MRVGKARWPIIIGMAFAAVVLLGWFGILRLRYEARMLISYEKVAGRPEQVWVTGQGSWPKEALEQVQTAARQTVQRSLEQRKAEIRQKASRLEKQKSELQGRFEASTRERQAYLAQTKRHSTNRSLTARLKELKTRQAQLIERFPLHPEIPVLGKQIKDLEARLRVGSEPQGNVTDLGRRIAETKERMRYLTRRLEDLAKSQKSLAPTWKIVQPAKKPAWPSGVEGWPVACGVVGGLLLAGLLLFRSGLTKTVQDGLWRPAPEIPLEVISPADSPAPAAVVESEPQLPDDPLTRQAASLYEKWLEISQKFYEPSPAPPQGVMDPIGPLLQETADFLPTGHDALARYLARSVVPGDLPAHVTRTVLMTLMSAQEAGVSSEHQLGIVLAALFHDLAVVPRPPAAREEIGSEVGRLSAVLLRKIPGLQPALAMMIEQILVGMDEFKLDVWQNASSSKNVEPLAKLLRHIDRFEKVMQKQKSRLQRRLERRAAS